MKKTLFFRVVAVCVALSAIIAGAAFVSASESGGGANTETSVKTDVITVISPTHGGTVDLTNDVLKKFYDEYTPKSGFNYYGKGEQCLPVSVTLKWTAENAAYYQVYLSNDMFFSTSEKFIALKSEFTLKNLYPNRDYYWKVKLYGNDGEVKTSKAYKFTTVGYNRTIEIDGASNVRDLGGVVTTEGKTFKYGLLYRSANLDGVTSEGKRQLKMLGIKTELDLRGDVLTESAIGKDVNFINIKGAHDVGHFKGIEFGYDENKEYIGYFCDELRACANADNYPMIFHCAIGRDRTGTLAGYIQMLCGVAEEDILREFETSFLSVAGASDNAKDPYSPFAAMINYIKAQPGTDLADKAAKYAVRMGITEADVAAIRNILLED